METIQNLRKCVRGLSFQERETLDETVPHTPYCQGSCVPLIFPLGAGVLVQALVLRRRETRKSLPMVSLVSSSGRRDLDLREVLLSVDGCQQFNPGIHSVRGKQLKSGGGQVTKLQVP